LLQLSLIDVTYAAVMRFLTLLPMFALVACNGEIFTRDGVTDGDTFYLAPTAFVDDSPALQSWVAYSLMKSTCQLKIGGDNPARASSFDCECTARRHLIQAWVRHSATEPGVSNDYLDDLKRISDAGFLQEYTASYYGRTDWELPQQLRTDAFREWRRAHLRRHRPVTRIVGSWGFGGGPTLRPAP
jgi:hypothetical protein